MDKQQSIQYLIRSLLQDMPSLRKEADGFPPDPASQRRLLRSLMNLRPPMPLQQDFLRVQDALLCAERAEKGVVEEVALPVCAADPTSGAVAGRYHPLEGRRHRQCGQQHPLGLFSSLPRLHRQRHSFRRRSPAAGCPATGSYGPRAMTNQLGRPS